MHHRQSYPSPRKLGGLVILGMLSYLGLAGQSPAAPLPPTAPSVSAGTYTVSPNGCNDYLHVMGCRRTWVEEKVEPNGSWRETNGIFTNKPPGTYSYRSGDQYCGTTRIGCTTRRGPAVTVTVIANAPRAEPLEVQQRYRFRVRQGNVAGNAGTDLLLERISGGSAGDGVLHTLLLEQVAGGFTARAPSYAQRTSSAWRSSNVQAVAEDLDVDGFIDVALTGVGSAIAGMDDQAVLSPGEPLASLPKSVRPIDRGVRDFTANMVDYMVDNDYFRTSAPLMLYLLQAYGYQCPQAYNYYSYYSGSSAYDYGFGSDCYWYIMNYYFVGRDFSVFSNSAVQVWQIESAVEAGNITSDRAADSIASIVESQLRYPIGGMSFQDVWTPNEPLPTPDERRGLEAFLAVLGIFNTGPQQADTEVAPEQRHLEADTIYIVGRYVFGKGIDRLHTALYYRIPVINTPNWLSAFDSDKRTLFDGTLVSETNDPRDNPLLMRLTLGTAESRDGLPAYEYYFGKLMPAHQHYDALPTSQQAPYDAIPELPPCSSCRGRNSNGYVNGILLATNGRAVTNHRSQYADMSKLTGWEYPVEAHYYGY